MVDSEIVVPENSISASTSSPARRRRPEETVTWTNLTTLIVTDDEYVSLVKLAERWIELTTASEAV